MPDGEPPWDALWGSTLADVQIDLLEGSVTLSVLVVSEDHTQHYRIEASGVTTFRYFNNIELPWSYAELTELHVHQSEGRVALDAVLWSEGAGIHIEAVAAELTGA